MRQKKMWRYYCDHCRKAGCGKAAMAKHEASCVRNPNRVCRMCEHGAHDQAAAQDLADALRIGGVDGLREAANGCPACMLATTIAVNGDFDSEDGPRFWIDFNVEKKRFWDEVNEAAKNEFFAICGYPS